MVVKLYTFVFSPPARLAKLVAEICQVDPEYVEVDLGKAEQLTAHFLKVNPKHQVPALEENGVFMAESRDICRHFFDKYNTNVENDHWYPKDPEKRQEVDKWLDWSKGMHSALEMAVVGSHCMSQQGMPWRDNYGLICCLISTIARRNPQPLQNLKKEVAVAEDMLSNRELRTVEDLNLGDLATFMELTMPMELHKEFQWSDYPNLENLYRVVSKVPGFSEIHQPFLEFCQMYRTHRDTGTSASWGTILAQSVTSVCLILRVIRIKMFGC